MGYGRHMRQRDGAVHFRRVVPKDLRARIGKHEIVRAIRALPGSERHLMSRRFWLACDEVFSVVRSEPSLTRGDIDELVAVYVDELTRRDAVSASWRPRRPLDQAEFCRQTQIGVYSDLARSVVDARRTNARLIDDEMLATVAARAGVSFDPQGLDAFLVQDALSEQLAQFYGQKAEELRRERRVGQPGGIGQFLRDLLGIADTRAPISRPAAPAPVSAPEQAPPVRAESASGVVNRQIAPQKVEKPPSANFFVEPQAPVTDAELSEQDKQSQLLESLPDQSDQNSFSALWDSFVHTKVSLRREWKPSRRPELLGTSRLWVWIVGDLPVGDYTSQHVRTFHDAYLVLPDDYMRLRHTRKGVLSPAEVVAKATLAAEKTAKRAGTNRAEFKRVNPKTFNKHLTNLKGFFAWGPVTEARPKDAPDPTRGFHIKIEKSTLKVRSERNMAPVKAIAELFESAVWTGRLSEYFLTRAGNIIIRDSLYWVPLMIAFHGLRREEAAQLRVHHIKSIQIQVDGKPITIWYFDLTAADLELKEPDKGSPRCVPFHLKFEQLGFLEDKVFGRRPDELLFPELTNENAHAAFGESIGKRFGNYVGSLEFSDASFQSDLSLQAMRHTVRTLLDNTDAKEAFVDELLGHESEGRRSEGRRYRKEVYLQNLKATIDLLELPVDVDRLCELALQMAPLRRKR
jgi:integrase